MLCPNPRRNVDLNPGDGPTLTSDANAISGVKSMPGSRDIVVETNTPGSSCPGALGGGRTGRKCEYSAPMLGVSICCFLDLTSFALCIEGGKGTMVNTPGSEVPIVEVYCGCTLRAAFKHEVLGIGCYGVVARTVQDLEDDGVNMAGQG